VKQGLASIVVCDNASTDDSEEQIREWAARYFSVHLVTTGQKDDIKSLEQEGDFFLIQTGGNRGYAGGNNVGIRYALSLGRFEFLWILNNDTVADKNALNALCQCARNHPQVIVFGSTLLEYTHRQRVQSAGGYRYFPALTIINAVYGGKSLSYVMRQSENAALDCVNGAALFARAGLFQELGLLNESYFLYYEELDLASRMKQRGYSARWCKNSIVYHKGAVSTGGGSTINPKGSWIANYHENLSTLKYTAAYHFWLLPFVAIFRFIAKCIVYVLHRQIYLFSALLKAYAAFLIDNKVGGHRQLNKKENRIVFLARIRP
jgi:GT2 family glycosyltransferase